MTASNNIVSFQPDLIQPTGIKGTNSAAEATSVGIMMREGGPYVRWVIGNDVARRMGLRAGSRIGFGIASDGLAAVVAPSPGQGWKLVKQSAHSLTVMVKADKLNLGHLEQTPLAPANFVQYDNQLIVDLSHLTTKE